MAKKKASKTSPTKASGGYRFQGGLQNPQGLFSVGAQRAGITKTGEFNTTTTNSFFYSPELTTESWLLPKSRQEILKWVRIFFNLEPYIQAITRLHARYPISKFDIVVQDDSIKRFYEEMSFNENFDLHKFLLQASLSYQKFGEAVCFGTMEKGKDGYYRWAKFVLLEPELVEVKTDMLTGSQSFEMIPTEEIKQLVNSQKAEDQERRQKLIEQSPEVVNAVLEHRNIKLEDSQTSMIANVTDPSATRGTSPIQACFKVLIYQDWIRLAQSAFAQRYVFPVELWTIGDLAQNVVPDDAALEKWRNLLNQAIQNPPFTIVAPPYVKYEPLSTLGKQFPINNEYEYIQDQLMVALGVNKNILLGEGPSFCLDDQSRILTKNGLKYRTQITMQDEVATMNPISNELEYHKPNKIYEFDHSGEMVHFNTSKIDLMVTPNHKCWVKRRNGLDWDFVEAKDVKSRDYMKSTLRWSGEKPADFIDVCGDSVPVEDYLKFAGYYISEGWIVNKTGLRSKRKNGKVYNTGIGQNVASDCFEDIDSLFTRMTLPHTNKPLNSKMKSWIIFGKDRAEFFESEFGRDSFNKKIPTWIKNLGPQYLRIVFDALMAAGDGSVRSSGAGNKTSLYYTYNTVSDRLASDVAEIALKLGYSPKIKTKLDGNRRINVVYISDSKNSLKGEVQLDGVRGADSISKVDYVGKVWCVEVPNHLFVAERNGHFIVTGNSNVKTMALHALIMTYKTIRDEFENWMLYRFFKPIAEKNGFTTTVDGEKKLVIPEISWYRSLDIEEQEAEKEQFMEMHAKGMLSTKTLYSKFPSIDYETEQKNLEMERGTIWDKGDTRIPAKTPKTLTKKRPGGGGGGVSAIPPIPPIRPVEPGEGGEEAVAPGEAPKPPEGAPAAPGVEAPIAPGTEAPTLEV